MEWGVDLTCYMAAEDRIRKSWSVIMSPTREPHRSLGLLFLPAAAECLVELNQRQQLIELGLHKTELSGERVGFVG
jgi:hypothetical protein